MNWGYLRLILSLTRVYHINCMFHSVSIRGNSACFHPSKKRNISLVEIRQYLGMVCRLDYVQCPTCHLKKNNKRFYFSKFLRFLPSNPSPKAPRESAVPAQISGAVPQCQSCDFPLQPNRQSAREPRFGMIWKSDPRRGCDQLPNTSQNFGKNHPFELVQALNFEGP